MLVIMAHALSLSLVYGSTWTIDKAHSSVGFKIRHLIGYVNGVFSEFEGTIEYDEKNPTQTKVDATIHVGSINTTESKRDDHLKSPEFFDAAQYHKMKFVSTKVAKKGKGKLLITGKLTIRDIEKEVVLNVTIGGTAKDPWGNTRAGFSGTAKLNRNDFGITWNKMVEKVQLVGEEVVINLEVEAIQKS